MSPKLFGRQWLLRARGDAELLHEAHEEDEKLLPCERLAETHALPDAERNKALQPIDEQLALLVTGHNSGEVGLRIEVVRVGPHVWIVQNCV